MPYTVTFIVVGGVGLGKHRLAKNGKDFANLQVLTKKWGKRRT